jgi:hypothetical protein
MHLSSLQSRIFKSGIAIGLGAIAAPAALAAPIPAINTLQDLINAGSAGVTVGGINYHDFSYQGAPPAGATPPSANPAPTASQILVTSTDTGNAGLRFTFAWNSHDGLNQDSVIRYSASAVGTNTFSGVGLNFNSAVTTGVLTSSSVTETIGDSTGSPLGQISVIDRGPGAAGNRSSDLFNIAPPLHDLTLIKDISVHSAPVADGGGTATITFVDNTFIPEPSTLGLIGLAAVGLVRRRRA